MQKVCAGAILAATLGIGLASGIPSPLADEGKGNWLYDLQAAQRQARRENRPIVAVLVCQH